MSKSADGCDKDPLALRRRDSSGCELAVSATSRHQPVMQEPRRWARAATSQQGKSAEHGGAKKEPNFFLAPTRNCGRHIRATYATYHGQFNEEKISSSRYSPLNFNYKIIKLSWTECPQRTSHGARGQCAKRFERFQSTNSLVNNPFDGRKMIFVTAHFFSLRSLVPYFFLTLVRVLVFSFRGHALYFAFSSTAPISFYHAFCEHDLFFLKFAGERVFWSAYELPLETQTFFRQVVFKSAAFWIFLGR